MMDNIRFRLHEECTWMKQQQHHIDDDGQKNNDGEDPPQQYDAHQPY
jgi:hypothetical protein